MAVKMSDDRVLPPRASPAGALALLASHYEEFGDRVLGGWPRRSRCRR
jgi:hypothetical protein